MSFNVLIIMVAAAVCCAFFRWRLAARTLLTLAVVLFLAIGCGPLTSLILGNLQGPYLTPQPVQWGKRNAIVLLGGGLEKVGETHLVEPEIIAYGRIVKATELYDECRKTAADCKILVTGGDPLNTGESEANVYKGVLTRIGVDPADVMTEDKSKNTWQNAQFSRPLLEAYGPDRIVLLTSAIHLRRGLLYFSHFGIGATPVRGDYIGAVLSPVPRSYNFAVADFALHEYAGILRYYVYNALGWNPARIKAGQA
ncbi:YdcF family protein [Brucella sp. IR073]|uniref:YdcF family protein n=1 Tax=unclassified Brucella TaxID=2632610 RepID=UPI003B97D07C